MFKKKSQETIYEKDLVGCFGKLPLQTEFIKHHAAASSEIIELDRWYQQAFHHMNRQMGDEFKSAFQKMPTYHFLYANSGKLPLLGTLMSSYDKGGRIYPYVSFRMLQHPLAQEFVSLIPWSYEQFLISSKRLRTDLDLTELIDKVNGLQKIITQIDRRILLESVVAMLKKISFNNFINYSSDLIAQTHAKILLLRNRQINLIRLPILNESLINVSVVFWLQLLEFVLSDKYLQVFWTSGNNHHKPNILICFQLLAPNNFQYLLESNWQLIDSIGFGSSFSIQADMSLFEVLQKWSLII